MNLVRTPARSPWASEEGREFLQERIGDFARTIFWIATGFYAVGLLLGRLFPATGAESRPLDLPHAMTLVIASVFLLMWRIARGAPLPVPVLLLAEGGGTVLACTAGNFMPVGLPVGIRPELVSLLGLMGILLYRSAVVPSDARRTMWIGVFATVSLPVVAYSIYARAPSSSVAASPAGYTAWALLWCALAVLLSAATSRVIYGLRETIREARRLGPYTLVEKIGEGGMGAVYRARHALLRRPTAIKILPPERAGEIDMARFEREVQMTSLLTSPHTVSVYDYGRTPDGLFYYAMEYLDGIDLQEIVRIDGPMPPGRIVRVLRQVCEALGEAHRVGLIHRDIKPANIILCERGGRPDVAKVVDFGLVKSVAGREPGVTREDTVLGTPHYMAPEALRSPDGLDARSDVYALGATAYFLLTGSPVFDGPVAEVFAGHFQSEPVPPSKRLGRPVPSSLEALVLAALAKSPDRRPESAEAFQGALAACGDVPAWTDAEASAWWRGPGAAIRAARSGATNTNAATQPGTLSIDRDAGSARPPDNR